MCIVQFGCGTNFLRLRVHERVKPDSQDYWDANWLHCTAEASAGAFRGTIDWQVRNEDLARWMHRLERFGGISQAEVILDTLDSWLDVRVIRDGAGHIEARCQLEDDPVGGNSLEFRLFLDQKSLSTVAEELRKVLERFPLIGQEEEN